MGRSVASERVPVKVIRETYALRQDGEIIRRECHIGALAGEPCLFTGPSGRLMARLSYVGKIRRVLASRVAWCLSHAEWPTGPVKPRNGDASDLRPENLALTKYVAPQPSSGGRASSLARRAETNAALLNALATRANPSLKELSAAVSLSEGRASARLTKLAAQGLTISPQCVPGRSWALTAQGRIAVQASTPVILDDLDKRILRALCWGPTRQLVLVGEIGCCSLTVKRRTAILIERGLVRRDSDRGPFWITDRGREALGPDAPKAWLRIEAVAASLAKDVTSRSSPDVLSNAERGQLGGRAAARKAKQGGRPRGGQAALSYAFGLTG